MLRRTLVATTLLATTVALPGCFLFPQGGQTPVFTSDDVKMEPPRDDFRALGEQGEVMLLADEVSADVNRWVAEIAQGLGEMVTELNEQRPTEVDGDWRVYGPHDSDNGEDASWMARISGDEESARFEVLVGSRGARAERMTMLFSGDLVVDGTLRSGGFTIDFDVIRKLAALGDELEDEDFGGKIAVTFSRDTATRFKQVDLDFQGFWYVDPDADEDLDFSGEQYAFHREDDGSGVFHFATWAPFEEEGWSGPGRERVTVDMAWNNELAGRARAQIMEFDGSGDLPLGDIELHECFSPGSALTWASMNEPYASKHPEYLEGDADSCVVEESALDGFARK